jgi:UDP-N-acetylglucosamine--N-acetylmuramyl-(pentapeptide) pyrophosphoryl-undecaprenol N-acetylglucosamine transferase
VMQQAREEQLADVRGVYARAGVKALVEPFFHDMHDKLAAAHLVIARAGASTVTELAIAGRPAILVPLAIAMDDHQTANAEHMVGAGAADIVDESRFHIEVLRSLLAERLGNIGVLAARAKAARALGQPDAARDLADLAETAAGVTGKRDA